jgi:Flp pilus assembly protein TadD
VPNHPSAQFFLGASLAELGRESEALLHLESAAVQTPNHPDVQNVLGMILGRMGRIEEGERHVALAASLGHPQARETLANTGMTWCPGCAAPRALADAGRVCSECGQA